MSTSSIIHITSCHHTPHQNGHTKCKHRHIVELSMSMLAHASMASHFWDEGIFTSYIINKLPIASLDFKTPLEVLFNIKPDHHFLKVFGCLCYPCLLAYTSNKLKWVIVQGIRATYVYLQLEGFILVGVKCLRKLYFHLMLNI